MASLKEILFRSPWIPYNNHFIQSRITLAYPENVIFTAQFIKYLSSLDVYKEYPYAEKMNVLPLKRVNWEKTVIVFDRDLQLILAPYSVQELIRLDRRLHYKEAAQTIFTPFRFFPSLEIFRYSWLGIVFILVLGVLNWLISKLYNDYSLALSSTTLNVPQESDL